MADTPQERTDEPGEGLGTTPAAPQSRTDLEQEEQRDEDRRPARETDDPREMQSPVTREEVERRQLDDEVDTDD